MVYESGAESGIGMERLHGVEKKRARFAGVSRVLLKATSFFYVNVGWMNGLLILSMHKVNNL